MHRNSPRQNEQICANPFEWFEIHPGGQAFLCCPAWLKTPIGNLLTDSVAAIWNSPQAVEIRKTILNGSFHRCSSRRCPRRAAGTLPVQRRADLPPGEARDAILQGQAILGYGPKKLNLCFDRSCNLACPSCRRELTQVAGDEKNRVERIRRKILDEAGRDAEIITLSGFGDPFGSPAYRALLEAVGPGSFPRLQAIHLHTNAQLWDQNMWHSLPGIHGLVRRAEISIDAATPKTYADNRGADFARLLRNLEFIRSLPVRVKISFVIQLNNYREMPAFAALAERFGCSAYFSQLVNWGTFSQAEFRKRAVHLPGHPEHREFIRLLIEVAGLPGVDVGNLSCLR